MHLYVFIIGGIIAALVLIAGGFLAYRNYAYNRPKTSGARLILGGAGTVTVLIVLGSFLTNTLLNNLLPVPCVTPTPSPLPTPDGTYTCVPGTITIDGSSALAPLVDGAAKLYKAQCSDTKTITVKHSNSLSGLENVENGLIDIGDSDVFSAEAKSGFFNTQDLIDHQVAVISFAIIINSQITGVTNLSTNQIQDIYSGRITNWKDLGGPDIPIVPFDRESGSGTRFTFDKYILGSKANASIATPIPTAQATSTPTSGNQTDNMISTIANTKGAIGYASYSAVQDASSGIKKVNINGQSPDNSEVESNAYTFWTIEHMYTKGPASGLAKAFINYMGSDKVKNDGIITHSFILISDMSQNALNSHQYTSPNTQSTHCV